MEPQTWAHLQAPGAGQRLIAGPCEKRIPMACRWEPRRRSMTKKVLLQRHRVQIGEASGPPKERLEPETRVEQHHHHPASPYPGDQRQQHQHQREREGEGRRDQQKDAIGGSAAADEGRIIIVGTLSPDNNSNNKRDGCRPDLEAGVSRMEVEGSDPGTTTSIATTGNRVTDRGDGDPADNAGDAEERGGRSASEKRECPDPEISPDDEEPNGTAGGSSIANVPAAAAVTSRAASEIAGDGERALSVSPPAARGLVPSSRPLDVAVHGKMSAATEAAVETPLAVVVTPSVVVADPRGDGDRLRKDDVVVEVKTTAAGDPLYAFNKSAPARRGKWSRLEEEYANRIINDFDEGVLDAAAGVSLRTLLASKLHCDVMRVSKKFKGWACVGKRSFRPVHHLDGRTARAKETLFRMEQTWLRSITAGSNSNGYFSTVNARKKYARGFGTPSPLPKGGQEQCQPADLEQQGRPSEGDRHGGGGAVDQGLTMRSTPPSSKNTPLHRQQQQQQQSWQAASGSSGIANEVRVPVMTLERRVSRGREGPGTSGTSPASHGSPRHVRPPPWSVASRGSALDNGAGVGPNGRNGCRAPYGQEEPAAITSRPSSAPQISSSHMQGSAPAGELPTVTPRPGHDWSTRGRAGPGGVVLPWQCGHGAALPGGASIGGGGDGDSDAELYPVYTKRARARSDGSTAAEVQHPTADGNTAGPDHRGYERFSWPQGSRLASAAAVGAGEVAPLGEQIARLQQRHMPRTTDRRNENNAHGHVRDVQQLFVGSARGFTAQKSGVRAGGVPRGEHGRPVGTAAAACSAGDDGCLQVPRPYANRRGDGVRLARNENPAVETAKTAARESRRPEFSPGMAPLAPSSKNYQGYSEGCDGRFPAEERGFLPTVLQQHQQQQPAKLRRIMGCFSRDSNGGGGRAADGGRRQDTYRDTRQWQATSQGYDQRQQEWRQRWQKPWPAPPRACQEERRAVTDPDREDRSILPGGPPPLPCLEPRGPRSHAVNLSFPSTAPPPIAPFPFPGRSGDDVGKGDGSGGRGAAEQARSGRTGLEDPATSSYSEVPSTGAGAVRRRSYPLYSRLGGSAFALPKPDDRGGGAAIGGTSGGGGAVVVAPTSEHRSTVVGPEGEHGDNHDGTSIASINRTHGRDYNKPAHFGARSLPALVRRISVGGGGGAGRVANRN